MSDGIKFLKFYSHRSSSGVSLRDHYILTYAEYLHSDPALWRITVDYMYSCGDVGKQQADEVLLRVPLRLHEKTETVRTGGVVGVLKDVNQTCLQHERESVRRTICRVCFSYLTILFSLNYYPL